jgi:FkbM family methyltransferase
MPDTSVIQKQQFLVRYRPGTVDENVINESFEDDLFLTGTPEYQIQSNHIILDVGAHIGCFSLWAASKATNGKVYCFEPGVESYDLLENNVQSNNFSNIKTFRLAMAGKNGATLLYHDTTTGNWGNSITKVLSAETETVNCITLKDFIESENIPQIDFIKFNCEGAEFGILLNTPAPILRRVKCMLILYHGYLEDTYSKKQLINYLTGAGFIVHQRFINKQIDCGSLIVYQAGFIKNIFINLRILPLTIPLSVKEFKRKIKRFREIYLDRKHS